MTNRCVQAFGVIALLGVLVSGCASDGTMGSSGSGSASGTVPNDSLEACLARISSEASPGAKQVAEESCRKNEALRTGIVGTATAKSGDRAASGTPGDTLEACMARIPNDATAGQKMLAEESCRRDQAARR